VSTTTQPRPMFAQTNPSTCSAKECQAAIHWRKSTATGKNICLDADPVESDARIISAPKFHYVITSATTCRPVTAAEWNDDDTPVYISHWRTCRRADLFNKGSR
jgi:hypothetical protein